MIQMMKELVDLGLLQRNKKCIKEAVFNTPLIRLKRVEKQYNLNSKFYIKLESFNPGGSVKDRPAYFILKDILTKNKNPYLVCASSGNFGISLAYYAKLYNLKIIVILPSSYSKERENILKSLNAHVIRGDFSLNEGNDIARNIAFRIDNGVFINQFDNKLNLISHYISLAPEIYSKIKPDYIICGIGSGGTIMGISKYFKDHKSKTQIIGVLPNQNPHKIEGIGAGFKSDLINDSYIDEIIKVNYDEALFMAKKLKELENIGVGLSTGASLFSSILIGKNIKKKRKKFLIISADDNRKYKELA